MRSLIFVECVQKLRAKNKNSQAMDFKVGYEYHKKSHLAGITLVQKKVKLFRYHTTTSNILKTLKVCIIF